MTLNELYISNEQCLYIPSIPKIVLIKHWTNVTITIYMNIINIIYVLPTLNMSLGIPFWMKFLALFSLVDQ